MGLSIAEFREQEWRRMTEASFQQSVEAAFRAFGWYGYHTLRSKGSEPGFPDWTAILGDRLVFAELKAMRGSLSDDQFDVLDRLDASGRCEVYVWRPCDYDELLEIARGTIHDFTAYDWRTEMERPHTCWALQKPRLKRRGGRWHFDDHGRPAGFARP